MPTSNQIKLRIKQTDAKIKRLTKELSESKKAKAKLASDLKKAVEADKKAAANKKSVVKKSVVKKKK